MVYKAVYLIAGSIVDRKTAKKNGWVDKDGFVKTGIEFLHSYPCCSDLAKKQYIVGRIVHIFYRVRLESCGKNLDGTEPTVEEFPDRRQSERTKRDYEFDICGKYYACKQCLGTVNGGSRHWFDVSKILNTVTECDPSTICVSCHDVEYVPGQKCRTCNYVNSHPATPGAYDLVRLVSESETPKFYLMLDDCLSCS